MLYVFKTLTKYIKHKLAQVTVISDSIKTTYLCVNIYRIMYYIIQQGVKVRKAKGVGACVGGGGLEEGRNNFPRSEAIAQAIRASDISRENLSFRNTALSNQPES